MTCDCIKSGQDKQPDKFLSCSGVSRSASRVISWDGSQSVSLAGNVTAKTYADRVGAPPKSATGQFASGMMCYIAACMASGRLIWTKQNAGAAKGDCGKQTKIDLGATVPIVKAAGLGTAGLSVTSAAVGASTGGFAGIGAAGTLSGTLASAATIVGLAALPFAVVGIFNAHHAAAMAKENLNLCDITVAYNNWAAQAETALIGGTLSLKDAQSATQQIEQQLLAQLKKTWISGCDRSCYVSYSLQALDLYNIEVYYPLIAKSSPSKSVDTSVASTSKTGNKVIAAGGAAAIAAGVVAII